jgi:hypothetical protein
VVIIVVEVQAIQRVTRFGGCNYFCIAAFGALASACYSEGLLVGSIDT